MTDMQIQQEINLPRKSFAQFAIFSFALLWVLFLFLSNVWQLVHARNWLILSSTVHVYQLARFWPALSLNHRPDEKEVLQSFGLGTRISLVRFISISILSGFLFLPEPSGYLAWLPAIAYLAAIFSDFFDGYLARITNHVTLLGQKLDLDLDARGLLVATLLAFAYGRVPWWYLSIGLARYLFTFGLYWRRRKAKAIYPLQPNVHRRSLAGTLMVFSTAMLIPIFSPPETKLVASLFMLPFLSNFLLDWWQVSGRARLSNFWSEFLSARLARFVPSGMFVLRLTLAGLLLLRVRNVPISGFYSAIEIGLAIALIFGVLGRTAAAILLIATGTRQLFLALGPLDWAILSIGTATLFLGTGKWSLYAPEEVWISHRPGEEPASDE